mmetsp:Transcript_20902/g.67328  ORF Transcript_20902/g.67328 Transcript_20902/m.67328 type:complete len:219 (+) Transcript_20902:115-771(+)
MTFFGLEGGRTDFVRDSGGGPSIMLLPLRREVGFVCVLDMIVVAEGAREAAEVVDERLVVQGGGEGLPGEVELCFVEGAIAEEGAGLEVDDELAEDVGDVPERRHPRLAEVHGALEPRMVHVLIEVRDVAGGGRFAPKDDRRRIPGGDGVVVAVVAREVLDARHLGFCLLRRPQDRGDDFELRLGQVAAIPRAEVPREGLDRPEGMAHEDHRRGACLF